MQQQPMVVVQPQQQQQAMMQQPMVVVQPQQQQAQQEIPAQQTGASSPSPHDTSILTNYLTPISNSTSTVAKIPKAHMLQLIGFLEKQFDQTLTGSLDGDILTVVFWMLCHVPPTFALVNLQCQSYGQLAEKVKVSANRVKDRGGKTNCALLKEMMGNWYPMNDES